MMASLTGGIIDTDGTAHSVSFGVIRCHSVSFGVIRCHSVSFGVIRSFIRVLMI